jgi:MFS transporter, SP family, sugar:H+ symporter
VSLALAAVPAGLLTLGALFLPETPNSLVQRGRDRQEVARLLQKIRSGDADVSDELDGIIAANEAASSSGGDGGLQKFLTQRRYRPQLVMAVAIPFFQQVTGINAIAFYAPVLLRTVGVGESASLLSAAVTGLVGVGSTSLSMLAVDRFGRRTLFLAGHGGRAPRRRRQGEQGVGGGADPPRGGVRGRVRVVVGPARVARAQRDLPAGGAPVAVSFACTVFVAQAFLAMLCHMKAGIFFFFAAWLAVMTAFVYFLLPETKGVPIEQVDRVWREHWFWSRIVDEARAGGKL